MKKIIMLCIAIIVVFSMVACTNKQEISVEKEEIKQETASVLEPSQEVKATIEDEENSIEKYKKLIGLSKEEVINAMGEEPIPADEGGLEFPDAGIRVWFIEDGITADQIFIFEGSTYIFKEDK